MWAAACTIKQEGQVAAREEGAVCRGFLKSKYCGATSSENANAGGDTIKSVLMLVLRAKQAIVFTEETFPRAFQVRTFTALGTDLSS
jgi:hypothetical protein